ncbi:FAD synthase [Drosophila albomicans]|uniref:FAD synthase n=1 Tax=Drosophila albomicans TaxID=7291 RepID=A0A6P8YMV8_DROAB|nr:FAD synthase [Drosophila albomicans]XP_034107766.1 FAD synthase [Drosophila albomicans]
MNKCCIQTTTQQQQATITQSFNIVNMLPHTNNTNTNNNNNNNNCKAHCNGSNKKCNPQYVTVSPEDRKHIEQRVQTAYEFFEKTLQIYRVDELIFCFNGGKDCTVLLDVLMRYCRTQNIASQHIPMLYIESDDSFPEIDEFVARCVELYDVKLIKYKDSLKQALTHMTEDMPLIKAVFVGSRNTDPHCEQLQPMQKTDSDWPDMMRLNPLLEWTYHDIWHYIHLHGVPYCSLYAQGYTSIGYKSNTLPNPHLKRCSDPNAVPATSCYRPAWELADPTQERAGRLSRK